MRKASADFFILVLLLSLIASCGSSKGKEQHKRIYMSLIGKRIFSDQRLAELEALMAIEKQKQRVAHGVFDPMEIGRRKRSPFGTDRDTQVEKAKE